MWEPSNNGFFCALWLLREGIAHILYARFFVCERKILLLILLSLWQDLGGDHRKMRFSLCKMGPTGAEHWIWPFFSSLSSFFVCRASDGITRYLSGALPPSFLSLEDERLDITFIIDGESKAGFIGRRSKYTVLYCPTLTNANRRRDKESRISIRAQNSSPRMFA